MKTLWNTEPAMIIAVFSAGLSLAMGFGLNITKEQMSLIMAFVSALLGLITRSQVTSPAALQQLTPTTLAEAQATSAPAKDVVKKLP